MLDEFNNKADNKQENSFDFSDAGDLFSQGVSEEGSSVDQTSFAGVENAAQADIAGDVTEAEGEYVPALPEMPTEEVQMPWYAQPSTIPETEPVTQPINNEVQPVMQNYAAPQASDRPVAAPPAPTTDNYSNVNPYASSDTVKPKKEKKYISQGVFFAVIAVILVVFIALGIVITAIVTSAGGRRTSGDNTPLVSAPTVSINDTPVTDTKIYSDDDILTPAQIAALLKPSVVSIITYDTSVFGSSQSQGSGIIYNSDGYIITNSHVIGDTRSNRVTVILSDNKTEYEAKVLGYDTTTDLAVLKIEATGLTAATFGNSDSLVTGDMVLAIGNPGGIQLAGSVSVGYVSGINRVIDGDGTSTSAMKYIQTDAAINPGNSGGALVNTYGEIVGINTAKISGDDYEGLGFAIPITTAKPIVEDLVSYGYVSGRVKLGITCYEVSSSMSYYYSIPQGLYVQSIDADSDLNGKVKVGEIITKINGKEISTVSDIQDITTGMNAGDTVKLTVYSGATQINSAKTYEVEVALIADKGDASTPTTQQPSGSNGNNGNFYGNNGNGGLFNFGNLF